MPGEPLVCPTTKKVTPSLPSAGPHDFGAASQTTCWSLRHSGLPVPTHVEIGVRSLWSCLLEGKRPWSRHRAGHIRAGAWLSRHPAPNPGLHCGCLCQPRP